MALMPGPPRPVVAEAEEALRGVFTGEQTYYQRFITYTDVADIEDFHTKLGVDLSEPGGRWTFSVNGATAVGFVAVARGRVRTRANGIVVTLSHERGRPLVWTVKRQKGQSPSNTQPAPSLRQEPADSR